MRTTFLSRSVIAVATLGIGSVALAAVPATAATPSGITRDMVLAASNTVRAQSLDPAEIANLNLIVAKACNFVQFETTGEGTWAVLPAGGSADGFLIRINVQNPVTKTSRDCVFAALATTDPAFTLSGNATVSTTVNTPGESGPNPDPVIISTPFALSGDVFVTGPVGTPSGLTLTGAGLSTAGNATRSFPVTTSTKVSTPKTTKQKKAAKKAYAKKLKAVKKAYAKALKKAGQSKSKKAKAKKAYAKKKAAAKATYRKAVATSRIVTKTMTQTENRAFFFSGVASRN